MAVWSDLFHKPTFMIMWSPWFHEPKVTLISFFLLLATMMVLPSSVGGVVSSFLSLTLRLVLRPPVPIPRGKSPVVTKATPETVVWMIVLTWGLWLWWCSIDIDVVVAFCHLHFWGLYPHPHRTCFIHRLPLFDTRGTPDCSQPWLPLPVHRHLWSSSPCHLHCCWLVHCHWYQGFIQWAEASLNSLCHKLWEKVGK